MSEIKLTKDGIAYEPIEPTYTSDVIGIVYGGKTHYFKPVKKEIHKPDWKIVYYRNPSSDKPIILCEPRDIYKNYPIHSVKRLTDNEIFTIGNDTNIGKITSFKICEDNRMQVLNTSLFLWKWLSDIEKVKPKVPLFTTEDGVAVFDKSETRYFVAISTENFAYYSSYYYGLEKNSDVLVFADFKKAEEYVLFNKPVEITMKEFLVQWHHDFIMFEKLAKHFFKEKINP